MSDIQFDDSLLNTTEELANVDWDNLEGSKLPEGKYLVLIEKVGGYLFNFQDYTCARAKLKMKVLEGPQMGQIQYDDINLPHPSEKKGNQNRRVLIASRLGLIPKGCQETKDVNWKMLENTKAVITIVHKEGDKDGKKQIYANVDFSGYESANNWQGHEAANSGGIANTGNGNGGGAAKETWDDI